MIVLIANEFKIPEAEAGSITYLTQAGYAIGLFFMVPLGDKVERKKQILVTTFASVLALILAAVSKSYFVLEIASLGITITTLPNDGCRAKFFYMLLPNHVGWVSSTLINAL